MKVTPDPDTGAVYPPSRSDSDAGAATHDKAMAKQFLTTLASSWGPVHLPVLPRPTGRPCRNRARDTRGGLAADYCIRR